MDGVRTDRKYCPGCGETKDRGEFYNHWKAEDGKQPRCSRCQRFGVPGTRKRVKGDPPVRLVGALRPVADYWAENGRRCTGCQQWKVWACYSRLKRGYRGYSPRCRECVNRGVRSSRSVNLKRRRRGGGQRGGGPGADYLTRGGVTRKDIEELVQAQQGACASCGADDQRLEVDHDEETGRLRELLCVRCLMAARLAVEPGGLRRLLAYLDKHGDTVRLDE